MPAHVREPIELELRAFVAAAGRTRALRTTAYVGVPGAERVALAESADLDQAMRTDLVTRALDGLVDQPGEGSVCAWVTRGGSIERHDADASWFAAARLAFARHDRPLSRFYVVNRTGWLDLVGGEARTWSRVRVR